MKKFFIVIFYIIIIFALCSCGKKTPVETSTASNDTSAKVEQASTTKETTNTEVKAKDATIEIVPPDGWTPVKGSVIPVQYMKQTASFMVKPEPYQSKDLDGVISEVKTIFEKSFDGVKFESEEKIEVDGKEARKMIFTCEISSMKMKFQYVFLFANEKVYVITFGDLTDTFDSLSSDYEQILKDIRFK